MTSPAQRNAGYLLPDNLVGDSEVCVLFRFPDTLEYRAAVRGQLYELGKWWTWEKSYQPGDTRATQAAWIFREYLYEYLHFGDCDELCQGSGTGGALMIGDVLPTARWEIPDTRLVCDGTTYNRVDYPELYDAIDPVYIIDADTFRVPDLRDKFVLGEGATHDIGDTGGEEEHTLTVGEIPAHAHSIRANTGAGTTGSPYYFASMGNGITTSNGTYGGGQSTGGGEAHNNMPPYHTLRYVIVAKPESTGGDSMSCEELLSCLSALFDPETGTFALALKRDSAVSTLADAVARASTASGAFGVAGSVSISGDCAEAALCYAARKTIDTICETEKARRDGVEDLLTGALTAVSVGMGVLAATGVATLVAGIGGAIAWGASAIIGALDEVSDEMLDDEDGRQELACEMMDNLIGKEYSAGNFADAMDGYTGDYEDLAGAVAYILDEDTAYAGFLDFLSAAENQSALGCADCECPEGAECIPCDYGDFYFTKVYDKYASGDANNPRASWISGGLGVGVYSGTFYEIRTGEIQIMLGGEFCVRRIDMSVYLPSSQAYAYVWNILDPDGNLLGTTNYMSYPNDVNIRATAATLTMAKVPYVVLRPTTARPSGLARVYIYACTEGQ